MLRDLVSLFARPSKVKSRRRRRGNNLRSLLSVEYLEERTVLSTSVAIAPEAGVFGLAGDNFKFQKLATFVVTTDDLNTVEFPSLYIDWDGNLATTGDYQPAEFAFTRTEFSFVPGETSTWEGIIYGQFNYASAGSQSAKILGLSPTESVMADENVSISVLSQYGGGESLSLAPPAGPFFEATNYTFTLNSTFGVNAESYSIDWGDGVQTGIDTIDPATPLTHKYDDDSPFALDEYKISIAVETIGGTFYVTGPTIQVQDVAPNVSISGPTSIAANDTYTLNLSSTDVSTEDYPVVWQVYWDFQGDFDNDPFEVVLGDATSVTHFYDSNGPRTIVALLTSDDSLLPTASNQIVVNVGSQPTADAGGPYTTLADVPITLTGVGGGGTNLAYAWDLDGDDTYGELGEVGAAVTFNPNGVAGPRTVRFKVTDLDTNVSVVDDAMITVNATGALVVDDTLHVLGSNTGGDTVTVSVSGGNIVVNTGSGPQTFSLASVDELNVRTGGGNDVITIAAAVTVPTTVDAGEGNDIIIGGSGRSVLIGGAGADIIYGGAGNDVLLGGVGNDLVLGGAGNDVLVGGGGIDAMEGGEGRDLLIGGLNSDALLGGGGEDILVGGYTIYDGNIAKLDEIMAVWSSAASFNARVSLLTAVGGLLRPGTTVFDDDSLDVITGGAGADLVFGDSSLASDGVIDLIALQAAQDRLIAVN